MTLPTYSNGYVVQDDDWNAHVSAINANTKDVSSLDGRVTTAEGNISSNDTDITNLDGRIDGNDTAIADLNTAVGMPYSNASDLDARVTTLENDSGGGGGSVRLASTTLADVSDMSTATQWGTDFVAFTNPGTNVLVQATASGRYFYNSADGDGIITVEISLDGGATFTDHGNPHQSTQNGDGYNQTVSRSDFAQGTATGDIVVRVGLSSSDPITTSDGILNVTMQVG